MSLTSYRDSVKSVMVNSEIKGLLHEFCEEFSEYKKISLVNEAILNLLRVKLTEKRMNGIAINSSKLKELING